MNRLTAFVVSAAVILAGCTALPTNNRSSTAVSVDPAESAATPNAIVIPPPPTKLSKAEVVLSDPRLREPEMAKVPVANSFAVMGDRVFVDSPRSTDEFTYVDTYVKGKRVRRLAQDDHYADDLLVSNGRLFVLEGSWDDASNYQVGVYRASGTSLVKERVIKTSIKMDAPTPQQLRFDGTNLIVHDFGDQPVVVEGPGPARAEPDFGLEQRVITVPGAAGMPQVKIQTRSDWRIEELGRDQRYVYYLVTDDAEGEFREYVYRISMNSEEPPQTYTPHPVHEAGSFSTGPQRSYAVDDGKLYQFVVSDKTVKVLRLHPTS